MDITELPEYIIEIEKIHRDVFNGDVDFTIKKIQGKIVSIKSESKKTILFNKGDNREPMLVIADQLANLSTGEKSRTLVQYESDQNGKIKKLTTSSEKIREFRSDIIT